MDARKRRALRRQILLLSPCPRSKASLLEMATTTVTTRTYLQVPFELLVHVCRAPGPAGWLAHLRKASCNGIIDFERRNVHCAPSTVDHLGVDFPTRIREADIQDPNSPTDHRVREHWLRDRDLGVTSNAVLRPHQGWRETSNKQDDAPRFTTGKAGIVSDLPSIEPRLALPLEDWGWKGKL